MYRNCTVCSAELGSNESIEHFPVGRRLAFDAAKGRLWVLCRTCGRWNLTPLEERWEAIEDCERLYRGARLRASTDNIGLARLRERVDLIRIGPALRREFAAWRYGENFKRRFRRTFAAMAATSLPVSMLYGHLSAAVLGPLVGAALVYGPFFAINQYLYRRRVVARVPTADGDELIVRVPHVRSAALVRSDDPDGWALRFEHDRGVELAHGAAARLLASRIAARINVAGSSSKRMIDAAVERIESSGGSDALLVRIADRGVPDTRLRARDHFIPTRGLPPDALFGLREPERLAVEMALNEESERRAMEGELAELEAAWRDAERIAAIADDLLLPPHVAQRFERLREGTRAIPPPPA